MLEAVRDKCGSSGSFKKAEDILNKLKEWCEGARQALKDGDPAAARRKCRSCLTGSLVQDFHRELQQACAERLVIPEQEEPEVEDEAEFEALIDFEKNSGLKALGTLGKLPSAFASAINAGRVLAEQRKNGCCALLMLKYVLSANSYEEAAVYAYYCVGYWHQISGLPEIHPVSIAVALELSRRVGEIPQDKKDAAIKGISAVLRSERCKGVRCY